MNLPIKLLGSLAVAGMVAAGGTAFTATGIDRTAVDTTRQIGGAVSQAVVGAEMISVAYTANEAGLVTVVTVTFADPLQDGSDITLDAFSGGGMTGPLANNSAIPPETPGVGPVFAFNLDGADENDDEGTNALTGITVTVTGNNVAD